MSETNAIEFCPNWLAGLSIVVRKVRLVCDCRLSSLPASWRIVGLLKEAPGQILFQKRGDVFGELIRIPLSKT